MATHKTRIIQISDTHIFSDTKNTLLGVNTAESLQAVIKLIQEKEKDINFILVTGDLSQDYSQNAYRHIADMLQPLQYPTYYVPGNHDDPQVMASVFPRGNIMNDTHIILNNWQLLLLNSHKYKCVEGVLDPSQLEFLETTLEKYTEHQAIVVFHHHPMQVGSAWLDKLGLTNADAFWDLVKKFPQVKHLIFGHVHQVHEEEINGVQCYSAPSTCIQFKRHQDTFGLENLNPGYRWYELNDDGTLETGVERLDKYIGVFDSDAKGY